MQGYVRVTDPTPILLILNKYSDSEPFSFKPITNGTTCRRQALTPQVSSNDTLLMMKATVSLCVSQRSTASKYFIDESCKMN